MALEAAGGGSCETVVHETPWFMRKAGADAPPRAVLLSTHVGLDPKLRAAYP